MRVDLIIKNAKVYNTYLKKFVKNDVAILDKKFLYIGKTDIDKLETDEVVDASGMYMIPGILDIHMHIESSMATPESFSDAVIKHGVTTIVSEPHEIANVLGLEGVKEMLNASKGCKIDIFYGAPSCVPSTSSEFETTGGEIEAIDLLQIMKHEDVICLGEVMNYVDLARNTDTKIHKILEFMEEFHPNKVIEGHCPQLSELELAKFIYSGVDSDHTQQSVSGMIERISNGMFVQIQHKSVNEEIISAIKENNLLEYVSLVTDDVMACDFTTGHMDSLIKKTVKNGLSIEEAIYIGTYTPSRRMKLLDRGVIAPGKLADFVLLSDLDKFAIESTYKNGFLAYSNGERKRDKEKFVFPEHFSNTVKLNKLEIEDLSVYTLDVNLTEVKCRVMEVKDKTTYVSENIKIVPAASGKLNWEDSDNCLIGVFERYGKGGGRALGLVSGNTITSGAVATTYAHDHHNLLVIGKNIEDMLIAANTVIDSQGGYCVVENGQVKASIELPIGGILSDKPMSEIGKELANVRDAMMELGYKHYSPIMSLSTHSLPVSPALKITDKGLIDVSSKKIVPLFCDE